MKRPPAPLSPHLPSPAFPKPLLLALPLAACVSAATAEPYPFEGTWDCGVGVFVITETTYNPGEEELEIISIRPEGKAHILTMVDGYQVGVEVNPDGTLHWLSLVSGDDFTCRPVP